MLADISTGEVCVDMELTTDGERIGDTTLGLDTTEFDLAGDILPWTSSPEKELSKFEEESMGDLGVTKLACDFGSGEHEMIGSFF